jgi:AcrR family transcriptional regulator
MMSGVGRPREHDEETGRALMDAAEALLASGGPDAVSVRGVAAAAATTTRAVYALFGSKAGLIEALAARGYQVLTDLVDALPVTADAGADLVAVGVHGFRRFALERPHLFRLTFERAPADISTMPSAVDAAMAAYGTLERRIERVRAADAGLDVPTHEAAFMVHALCVGLAGNELAQRLPPNGVGFWRHVPEMNAERVWSEALTALISGLTGGRVNRGAHVLQGDDRRGLDRLSFIELAQEPVDRERLAEGPGETADEAPMTPPLEPHRRSVPPTPSRHPPPRGERRRLPGT